MAWKNIGSNKLIFTLIFIFVFSCGAGLDCGYPGSPAFGRPVPVRESYRPGNTVTFHCVHGYTLKGFHQKTCLDNGTWTGIIPICDQSLHGMDQHAYTRAPYDPAQFGAEKAIDGNRDTCTYTDPMKPRWVRVDLKHNHLVEAVAVTVPKNLYLADPAHFLIYVISVKNSTTSGSATYHKCAEFSGKFSTPTVKLSCATGGFYGRYVHIEDQRNSRAHFGICEIDIFVQKDSYDCGEPDRPSNSYTSNPEAGVVEYRCVYGYQLEGAVRRKCLLDGQWSGTQPLCIEIICPALTLAENGVIQYTGPVRGKLVQGTIANVTCDYGYRSSGLALHCLDTSLWSEGELECQPIDCKVPTIRNDLEKYVLINGSTTYGSMAFLNCDEVGSQDEQASSIRICREDGLWSPPTIDCIPSDPLKTLGLVEDDENIVPNGVIIGMAVVVFLLLLILILILLFKRKQLSRRQSAESLPSKDTSSSLTVSEIKNGLPYENDAFYASITVEDPKNQLKNETKNKPQSENDNPPMVEKGILSTILFAKRKASSNEKQKSRNGSISSGSSPSFYEEIGLRSSGKKSGKQTKKAVNKENNDIQPVYAQVDMDEKRRSRLAKIVPNHSNKTFLHKTEINDISGSYHSEEAPNYDSEPDLEPVVLRELPPIPDDDDQSSGTYASLSRPPEPPTMTSPSVFMRENAIYAASQITYETPNQHIMKDNDVYSA